MLLNRELQLIIYIVGKYTNNTIQNTRDAFIFK